MLSKSDYLQYLKHPAWVWLKKHDKSKLPPVDEDLQARFDDGNLFESYANQLFPHATKLEWNDYSDYKLLPQKTMEALREGAFVIQQGRFEAGDITCIVDVLEHVESNVYNLYEIKASTQAKPEHVEDLAFQTIVLERCGLEIKNTRVIHVDNTYIRKGEISVEGLTATTDITEKVKAQIPITESGIEDALSVISQPDMPDPSPRYASSRGFQEWMDVFRYLYPDTDKHSIYNLPGIRPKLIAQLEDAGIEFIHDIPEEYPLGDKSLQYIKLLEEEESRDANEIRNFLQSFQYPLYFLDYETYGSVIPPFDGMRPYQQIPFQYSLHRIDAPDAEVVHTDYLHTESSNPASAIVSRLKEDIGSTGAVVVWNESFEKTCNSLLADMVPEESEFLHDLNDRVVDLMVPFSKKWFEHRDFLGSASIKAVLPVLVPELSYKELEVSDGGTAQRLWAQTILRGENDNRQEQVLEDLRAYCELDTLAMVKIWRILQGLN
ncbi:MAG: DUF2779 domain-containing protein [Candidatus Campbellbacteria bacterium]|nr:DUF2779 domain-containing protein [Candidatus Campbellbacteria bacterium]